MRIAYNPSDKKAYTPISEYNKDIVFDLVSKIIYVRGEPFIGHYETFKKHTSDNKGGSEGLVPIPSYSTSITRFLCEDGKWKNITDIYPIDITLNTNSTNAIANKTVSTQFDNINEKLGEVYGWYSSITDENTDEYIDDWNEIVDFLNELKKEDGNILDQFVTVKKAQAAYNDIITHINERTPKIQIVNGSLPSSLDANTIYFIK